MVPYLQQHTGPIPVINYWPRIGIFEWHFRKVMFKLIFNDWRLRYVLLNCLHRWMSLNLTNEKLILIGSGNGLVLSRDKAIPETILNILISRNGVTRPQWVTHYVTKRTKCHWPFVMGNHQSPWIPLTKASDPDLWCILWSVPEQTVEQTIETPVIWDATAPIMTSL